MMCTVVFPLLYGYPSHSSIAVFLTLQKYRGLQTIEVSWHGGRSEAVRVPIPNPKGKKKS